MVELIIMQEDSLQLADLLYVDFIVDTLENFLNLLRTPALPVQNLWQAAYRATNFVAQ